MKSNLKRIKLGLWAIATFMMVIVPRS